MAGRGFAARHAKVAGDICTQVVAIGRDPSIDKVAQFRFLDVPPQKVFLP